MRPVDIVKALKIDRASVYRETPPRSPQASGLVS
jgi:hypothetical protein